MVNKETLIESILMEIKYGIGSSQIIQTNCFYYKSMEFPIFKSLVIVLILNLERRVRSTGQALSSTLQGSRLEKMKNIFRSDAVPLVISDSYSQRLHVCLYAP